MMRCVRWVGDWAWVVGVFLAGKVLRMKKYRPEIAEYTDGVRIIRFRFFLRVSRLKRLSRLWGYKIEPFQDQSELKSLGEILYLQKDRKDVTKITMPVPFRPLRRKISNDSKSPQSAPKEIISASS